MEKNNLKIVFVWHWVKRLKTGRDGEKIAVEDTLFDAIYKLAHEHEVTIIALSPHTPVEYVDEGKKVRYIFCQDQDQIVTYVRRIKPDILFLNHHSQPYDSFLADMLDLETTTIIYYSSPILLQTFDLLRFKYHFGIRAEPLSVLHKKINFHIVHHQFQKDILAQKLSLDQARIFVAPKSANLDIFFPLPNIQKTWDVIYPGRSTEGYWKRPELAIKATAKLGLSLFMPGAKLKKIYPHVTIPKGWLDDHELNLAYNQSRILLVTSDYREMGPRVIPEAMACNIPVICCADSPACVSHVKQIGGYIAKPDTHDIAKKILLARQTICNTRGEMIRIDQPNAIWRTITAIL